MMADERERTPAAGSSRVTSMTLMRRLRSNEAQAWDRLVELYGPLVNFWCVRWGASREDCEDVVQEVFRVVSGALDQFRDDHPGATFRGWLRGVTRNQLLMHARRKQRHPQAEGGTDAFMRIQNLSDNVPGEPEEDDPAVELNALYFRALKLVRGEFEDRTWQAFWRYVVDGQTPAMIAAETGVSPAAVRKAKSRVLRRLKEEVGELID